MPLKIPVMRKTAGAHITIPQASERMGIGMDRILFALAENDFAVTGDQDAVTWTGKAEG